MSLTFEDGIWCVIEFLGEFDDCCAREAVRELHISREQAIELQKKSSLGKDTVKELDEMDTWKNPTPLSQEKKHV